MKRFHTSTFTHVITVNVIRLVFPRNMHVSALIIPRTVSSINTGYPCLTFVVCFPTDLRSSRPWGRSAVISSSPLATILPELGGVLTVLAEAKDKDHGDPPKERCQYLQHCGEQLGFPISSITRALLPVFARSRGPSIFPGVQCNMCAHSICVCLLCTTSTYFSCCAH